MAMEEADIVLAGAIIADGCSFHRCRPGQWRRNIRGRRRHIQPHYLTPASTSFASVAIGDVNGDGIPDIVTAGGTILFGDGKGGFPSRADYVISNTGAVQLTDFDGDGIADILVGDGAPGFLSGNSTDPSLTVLFGAGGGSFTGAPLSALALTPDTDGFVSADFNGDGFPDLVSSNVLNNSVQLNVLRGEGNGSFQPSGAPRALMTGGLPLYAVAADFDHDGKPDVATLVGGSQVSTGS